MQEIADKFKEELQELLNRYKDHLTTPQIMRIAQPIFTKTLSFRDNPERFKPIVDEFKQRSADKIVEKHLESILSEGESPLKKYNIVHKVPDSELKKIMQNDTVTLVKDNPERPSRALNYLMQSTGYNKPSSEGEPKCTD